uniref:Uncharacterized protein n=1 Tax=Glossina palpalis gambiensis TaxID=67801 RepID=A0A1B0BJ56_9MUSC
MYHYYVYLAGILFITQCFVLFCIIMRYYYCKYCVIIVLS